KESKFKSQFLAAMSHEIRTPMNAIIGVTQIERHKEDLPEEYAHAFDRIHSSCNTLLGIINDILDLSKIESGKLRISPSQYDVASLINDTVQVNVARIENKPIHFILELSGELPSQMYGDEVRLKQILNNLLSNAFKFTDRGSVTLTVSHAFVEGDVRLRFKVADTGQGIKAEEREKLFTDYSRFHEPVYRTTEGAGLGLNIVKHLVDMMDGEVSVESEYNKGSTFYVDVAQEYVECENLGDDTARKLMDFTFMNKAEILASGRTLMPYGKVLVIDDVEANLFVAEGLLKPYELNIETGRSGYIALERVKKGSVYDIIFMDHMMPKLDGIETTKKLREMGYEGIIIALSANALAGNDEMFKKNGFDEFVPKPIDVKQLDGVLNEYIRDKHFPPPPPPPKSQNSIKSQKVKELKKKKGK
ncbi:MAG: ATP-binding protein, partial [Oscillospiraceae bacterium]|nr:ATP-binding protein [Oscillospiraceae bacterium]